MKVEFTLKKKLVEKQYNTPHFAKKYASYDITLPKFGEIIFEVTISGVAEKSIEVWQLIDTRLEYISHQQSEYFDPEQPEQAVNDKLETKILLHTLENSFNRWQDILLAICNKFGIITYKSEPDLCNFNYECKNLLEVVTFFDQIISKTQYTAISQLLLRAQELILAKTNLVTHLAITGDNYQDNALYNRKINGPTNTFQYSYDSKGTDISQPERSNKSDDNLNIGVINKKWCNIL